MKDLSAARRALLATAIIAVSLGGMAEGWAASTNKAPVAEKTETDTPDTRKPSNLMEVLFGVREDEEETTVSADEETVAPTARNTPPATLRALIRKHAEAMGVPVELAEAVVHVESRFNPRARGRAGEVGLMQIKPATARAIGYRGTTKDLYDPNTNLKWGMLYLAKAYELAGGDTCGAILRYNGGHAARKMTKGVRTYCGKVNRYVASL